MDIFSPKLLKQLESKRPFAKLHELVYFLVEDAILSFKILPLAKIKVSTIAKSLEISRTPVQEALENLYKVGLLTRSRDAGGYIVFALNSTYVYQLFEVREIIDTGAARLCAKRNSKINFSLMGQMCRDIVKYSDAKDYKNFTAADHRFHQFIIESTNNPHVKLIDERVDVLFRYYWGYIARYLQDSPPVLADRFDDIAYQHLAIYKSIKLGSPEMAESAAINHLNSTFVYFCLTSQNVGGMQAIQLGESMEGTGRKGPLACD
ncbi:MAG: GntR family transcriptional regulator [Clostridiales Family XIII bacterium]|jgi:DNA-binding GntR family transcriptional regulator|nr:GntR family transcriptional regulator [Clostridiales Family XIII bacterium]